ncbi:MAG: phosphatase PAP2 family protein [Deltaproteobacteria bacterium]|nr:phosphatase PAP2 family protein [Deltaproteobacteria bacterium]
MPQSVVEVVARPSLAHRVVRNLAVQDVVVPVFLLKMIGTCMLLGAHRSALLATGLLAIGATAISIGRSELGPRAVRVAVYRIGVVAPLPGSYALFQDLVDPLRPVMRDSTLRAIDSFFLGDTAAILLVPFQTPGIVEWFAFFYFSYYFVMGFHLLGSLAFDRGTRLAEIMLGALLVTAIGHTIYTWVPALGPLFAVEFPHELRGGLFFGLVDDTVRNAGAGIDIFPSLHTALPTFFVLHSLRHRKTVPFKYTWPVAAIFAGHIVIATMLLRLHYAVDVVAGMLLAAGCQRIAIYVANREKDRTERGIQPVWEPIRLASTSRETARRSP